MSGGVSGAGEDPFGEDPFAIDFDAEFQKMMEEEEVPVTERCRILILTPIDAPGALRAALDMIGSPAPVVGLSTGAAVYREIVGTQGQDEAGELLALLGGDRPLPDEADALARLLSKLSKHGVVAVASWVTEKEGETSSSERQEGSDEEGEESIDLPSASPAEVSGTMVARRYVNGEPEETLSAGLVLARTDLAAEELMLGRIGPEQVKDYQDKGPWSGWLKGRGKR